MPFGQREPLDEVHQNGVPRPFSNQEETMRAIGLVMKGQKQTAQE